MSKGKRKAFWEAFWRGVKYMLLLEVALCVTAAPLVLAAATEHWLWLLAYIAVVPCDAGLLVGLVEVDA